MSELDKMLTFGAWLSSRRIQVQSELNALSTGAKYPEAAIRVKAGHLEALTHVLTAFASIHEGDVAKFKKEYLGGAPEDEDDQEEEPEEELRWT